MRGMIITGCGDREQHRLGGSRFGPFPFLFPVPSSFPYVRIPVLFLTARRLREREREEGTGTRHGKEYSLSCTGYSSPLVGFASLASWE